MWIVWSIGAAVIWGINYAASGRVLSRGLSPLNLFLADMIFGGLVVGGLVLAQGKGRSLVEEVVALRGDYHWFAVALVASASAGVMIFLAIEAKNATIASLIEISYPFFVALFAWIFFREAQLNAPTVVGGLLILAGVLVIYLSNREPAV